MSQYRKISDFGTDIKTDNNNPVTLCLVDSMDVKFQNGSIGNLFGPRSRPCQLYMAERCSKDWDGYCEYYYRMNSNTGDWPNSQPWPNTVQERWWANSFNLNKQLSTGEQLLQNAAERKYCTYPTCSKFCERMNPTDPKSPMITYYANPYTMENNCVPECSVDPSKIEDDPVMNRCLENPSACAATLMNVCITAKRKGTNLNGTKLGKFCDAILKQ